VEESTKGEKESNFALPEKRSAPLRAFMFDGVSLVVSSGDV